jgi:hypothetical protein
VRRYRRTRARPVIRAIVRPRSPAKQTLGYRQERADSMLH